MEYGSLTNLNKYLSLAVCEDIEFSELQEFETNKNFTVI